MAGPEAGQIEFLFSNMNLPPAYFLPENLLGEIAAAHLGVDQPRGSLESHRRVLARLNRGADGGPRFAGGYDVTPARALTASLRAVPAKTFVNRVDPEDPASGKLIGAGHEGWSPGLPRGLVRSLRQRDRGPLQRTAAMVEQSASRRVLRRLSDALGGLPITVYGEEPGSQRVLSYRDFEAAQCAIQLKPEVLQRLLTHLDINNLQGEDGPVPCYAGMGALTMLLGVRGISGVVIDTHWIQSAAPDNANLRLDPAIVLSDCKAYGIPIKRAHASAGRLDPGTRHSKDRLRTMAELRALLKSPEAIGSTAMGEILAGGYQIWRDQQPGIFTGIFQITQKVPLIGLERYREERGQEMGPADFVPMHQDIGDNLRGFMASL